MRLLGFASLAFCVLSWLAQTRKVFFLIELEAKSIWLGARKGNQKTLLTWFKKWLVMLYFELMNSINCAEWFHEFTLTFIPPGANISFKLLGSVLSVYIMVYWHELLYIQFNQLHPFLPNAKACIVHLDGTRKVVRKHLYLTGWAQEQTGSVIIQNNLTKTPHLH